MTHCRPTSRAASRSRPLGRAPPIPRCVGAAPRSRRGSAAGTPPSRWAARASRRTRRAGRGSGRAADPRRYTSPLPWGAGAVGIDRRANDSRLQARPERVGLVRNAPPCHRRVQDVARPGESAMPRKAILGRLGLPSTGPPVSLARSEGNLAGRRPHAATAIVALNAAGAALSGLDALNPPLPPPVRQSLKSRPSNHSRRMAYSAKRWSLTSSFERKEASHVRTWLSGGA
jgi:hypothetical protein